MTETGQSPAEAPRRARVPGWVRTLAGILVSMALLVWAGWNVDFGEAWKAVIRVDFGLYGLSMIVYLGTMALRAPIIMTLLEMHGKVGLTNALPNLILGYFCNNILPLKVGEVVRTGLITREAGIPFWTGLSALVIERSLDVVAILAMALVTSFLLPLPPEVLVSIRVLGAGLLVVYLGLVALAVARRKGWTGIEKLSRKLPGRTGAVALRIVDQLAGGLRAVGNPWVLARTILWVTLFWCAALLGWYIRLRAFGLADSFVVAPFVVIVVGMGVSVPSAPSYAGVIHGCVVFALAALSVDENRSFPFAVFLHAVDFVFVGILGLAMMAVKGISFGGLRAAAKSAPGDDGPKPDPEP